MKSIVVGPDQGRVVPKENDLLIVLQEEEIENFKQALTRATAHWQDAPLEILLLKRKLCGDPILSAWPNPKDFKMDLSTSGRNQHSDRKEAND